MAEDEARRISQPKAKSSPYPAALPLSEQIVGVSRLWSTTGGAVLRSNSPPPDPAAESKTPNDSLLPICEARSRPAQKAFPAPVRTIQRTSRERSARKSCSDNSVNIAPEMVFRRSGAFRVIVATFSETSYKTSLICPP